MATTTVPASDPAIRPNQEFLDRLTDGYGRRDFSIRYWDGTSRGPDAACESRFTLVLRHPGSVKKMFTPPVQLALGEAYIFNDFDVEGDLEAFWDLVDHWILVRQRSTLPQLLKLRWAIHKLPSGSAEHRGTWQLPELSGSAHNPTRDAQANTYHYGISNEFYALFLDERMLYTTAYFKDPNNDIHTAQLDKLDHVCRKLRLKPGDRMLDVGCGWGGLAIHAAQKYGARVLGVTVTPPQKEWADRRIKELGLGDRCRVELMDYRAIDEPESFDKIAAIGCMEHIGEVMLPVYFRQAMRLLKPGGVFLNHCIARGGTIPRMGRPNFIDKYVFPDAQLEPISTTLRLAEKTGFEVRDVECLREHYIPTLRHWLRRLDENADRARQLTSEVAYRIYRFYITGSIYAFKVGRASHYQSLLLKQTRTPSGLPLTRDDWYR